MWGVREGLGISKRRILHYHQKIFLKTKELQSGAWFITYHGFGGGRLLSEKGLCFQYLKTFLYLKKRIVMFLWIQVLWILYFLNWCKNNTKYRALGGFVLNCWRKLVSLRLTRGDLFRSTIWCLFACFMHHKSWWRWHWREQKAQLSHNELFCIY